MITEKEYLEAQKIVDKYKSEQLNKPVVSSSADTGGIDKYFEDLFLEAMFKLYMSNVNS